MYYPFISKEQLISHLPEMEAKQVSVVARSPEQFVSQYLKYGKNMPLQWQQKRNAFIARHLAAYKINPTRRRELCLLCWGFDPEKY